MDSLGQIAWQIAFLIIGTDPERFRPLMVACVFEKFSYAAALGTLYLQGRLHATDLVFGAVDLLLGTLFVVAFFRTKRHHKF